MNKTLQNLQTVDSSYIKSFPSSKKSIFKAQEKICKYLWERYV